MSHDTPKEKPPGREAPRAEHEVSSSASVPQHPYAARPIDERLAALQAVPPAMAAARQWLLYRLVPKEQPGKWDKVPHYAGTLKPRRGEQGTAADRAALVPLQEALAALQRHARRFDGVGFALLPDGEAACVDLDGDPAVAANADLLAATWAEASMGGHGAHAWFAGAGLPHGKNLPAGVESFAANGFVAVTGLPLPGAAGSTSRTLAPAAGAWAARVQALLGAPGSSQGLPGPAAEGAGAARSIPSPWDAALATKVQRALSALDPDMTYTDWVRVGMALHSADPDPAGPAFAAWLAWSKQGAKFAGAKDLRTRWRSFAPQGGVTVAALFAMYRDHTGRSINDVEAEADEADFPASRPKGAAAAPEQRGTVPARALVADRASALQAKHVPKMWGGRLPQNCISILAGEGGKGKGQIACALVAALVTGRSMPGTPLSFDEAVLGVLAPPVEVLWFSAEDDPADEIKQRLRAAGAADSAALDRVHFVRGVAGNGDRESFSLRADMDTLRDYLRQHPQIGFVVFDPATSYLAPKKGQREVNLHNVAELRGVLEPLRDTAQEHRVSVLCLTHFTKDSTRSLVHRITGSGAWTDLARSVLVVVDLPEPDEEGEPAPEYPRAMLHVKTNTGPLAAALLYRTVPVLVQFDVVEGDGPTAGEFPRVEWGPEDPTLTESALLRRRRGPAPVARQSATEWLRSRLQAAGAPVVSNALERDALLAGISPRTLDRARGEIGATARRLDGRWHTALSWPRGA